MQIIVFKNTKFCLDMITEYNFKKFVAFWVAHLKFTNIIYTIYHSLASRRSAFTFWPLLHMSLEMVEESVMLLSKYRRSHYSWFPGLQFQTTIYLFSFHPENIGFKIYPPPPCQKFSPIKSLAYGRSYGKREEMENLSRQQTRMMHHPWKGR